MCQADLKLKNFHFSVTAAVVVVSPGGPLFFHKGEATLRSTPHPRCQKCKYFSRFQVSL